MFIEDKISEGMPITQNEQMYLLQKGRTWLLRKYMAAGHRLCAKAQILMLKLGKDRLFKDYVVRYELAPIAQVKLVEMKKRKLFAIFLENHQLSLIAQKKLDNPACSEMMEEYLKHYDLHFRASKH